MEQAIRGRVDSRLRDLAMMTEFAHTGPNEALNAMRNKASKVVRFYYGGVLVEGGSMGHLLILITLLVIRVIFPDPDRHQWHADPEP